MNIYHTHIPNDASRQTIIGNFHLLNSCSFPPPHNRTSRIRPVIQNCGIRRLLSAASSSKLDAFPCGFLSANATQSCCWLLSAFCNTDTRIHPTVPHHWIVCSSATEPPLVIGGGKHCHVVFVFSCVLCALRQDLKPAALHLTQPQLLQLFLCGYCNHSYDFPFPFTLKLTPVQ